MRVGGALELARIGWGGCEGWLGMSTVEDGVRVCVSVSGA